MAVFGKGISILKLRRQPHGANMVRYENRHNDRIAYVYGSSGKYHAETWFNRGAVAHGRKVCNTASEACTAARSFVFPQRSG